MSMHERVLIVEDDPATSEGLSFHLHSLGFEVAAASDGAAALAALRSRPPDVLLLDLMLPGDLDGIQVLRTARQLAPRVGAIVMTGFPSGETTVQALRLGAYDYVAKPFDLGAMSTLLVNLVKKLRAERQVAESATQFETLLQGTRLAVNGLDPSGRLVRWGSAGLLGYSAEEMLGGVTPAAFILTPGYDLAAELAECRRERHTVREHRMRHKDGRILWVREERLPVTDRQGGCLGFTSLLLDLTEERRAQEAAERKVRALDQRVGQHQRALEAVRALGDAVRTRTAIPDLMVRGLEFLVSVVRDVRLAWCFLVEAGDEDLPEVAMIQGRRVLLGGSVGASPLPGPGLPHGCGAPPCDCLDRLGDADGRPFAPLHLACPRLVGSSPAAAGHLTLPLVIYGELVGVVNLAREGLAGFSDEEVALLNLLADQLAAGIAASRLDARGQAVVRELREQQRRVVESEKLRAVGELASGVAHDFNNLLTAILGSTELLLREESDPRRAGELQVIRRAAEDGAETVRRILEYARARTDRQPVRVDLRQIVSEAVELTRGRWRDSVQARGISIEVRPELAPVPAVSGVPAEFRELLMNLILNAVDAMPQGGTLRLATRVLGEGDGPGQVEVVVADSGVGMAQEVLDRIFDPFFTTKESSGSGLGLAMAYAIVQRHQGEIQVRSAPGDGSAFTLRFPALPEAADPPHPAPAATAFRTLPRARVLVVDDEARLAQLLRAFLELQGHEVVTATGGREALGLLATGAFDCILTDLGMPEVSGWDVAREAARRCPDVPVVLISGWGAQIDAAEVRAAGIARVIQKPYTFDAIGRALSELLSR